MNTHKTTHAAVTFWLLVLAMGLVGSCTETPVNRQSDPASSSMQDSVIRYNHQIVESEIQEMDDYIFRYQWVMKNTETGLRYMIYRNGDGHYPKEGDTVTIKYSVNLLNGDLIYRSDTATPYAFILGKRNIVSGLEEGIMLMNAGSRSKLILPSHLAFGLLGDMSKIPSRAVLVCDVEICAINPGKK